MNLMIPLCVERVDSIRIHAVAPAIVFAESGEGWTAEVPAYEVLRAAYALLAANDDELPAVTNLAEDLETAVRFAVDNMTDDQCRAFWVTEVGHEEIEAYDEVSLQDIVYDHLREVASNI